jgi:CDK inhibitor PHO81
VLLCNDLGADAVSVKAVQSSGCGMLSVKEAVNVARGNNFMGLICRQRLLVRPPSSPFNTH